MIHVGPDRTDRHTSQLKEFQELFDREARKHNIYPMANSCYELLAADRPKLVSGNKASFTPGTVRLPEEAIIDIKNRSFSIVAEVENPDGDAEGILVTLGGETGGFAFLVLDRKPASSTAGSVWRNTRSPPRNRWPGAAARSASTSPTTAAAPAKAARARCR